MATKTTSLTDLLRGHQFCLLTTFRKDGTGVPTPMWFAVDDETVYMSTRGGSAKVKRLRNNQRVTIGPCNGSGFPLGEQVEANGRLLESLQDLKTSESTLAERYGLKRRLLRWALRFAKDKTDAHIAVRLAGSP